MTRPQPQFDARLIGVWSRARGRSASPDTLQPDAAAPDLADDDVRILYRSNYTGRYETWHHGLNEAVTFNWSPPEADRVTMAGIEYLFRDAGVVRREPCDWHFEAVPYWITVESDAAGAEIQMLRLKFGPQRVDAYGLVTADPSGFEHPEFG